MLDEGHGFCFLALGILLVPRHARNSNPNPELNPDPNANANHPQEREVSVQHLVWLPRVVVACVAVHPGGRSAAKSGAQVRSPPRF